MASCESISRVPLMLIAIIVAVVALAACNRVPSDSADALARDPQRLAVVLRQCRDKLDQGDDRLCHAASEAWRRRFFDHDRKRVSPTTPSKEPPPPEIEPVPWMFGS